MKKRPRKRLPELVGSSLGSVDKSGNAIALIRKQSPPQEEPWPSKEAVRNFIPKICIKMEYQKALEIAEKVRLQLLPHCYRCEIAGSIRRKKPDVKDIEIVAIPKPYQTGLFQDGVAEVVNQWEKVKGELPCKYTQRILPEGIKLDLFFAEPGNWGLIFAIRTGNAEYSHRVLALSWVKLGYNSVEGYLIKDGKTYDIPEEKDLFNRLRISYVEPEFRNI